MRNKDNRNALLRQRLDGFEQNLRLRFGKDGSRLIQHQQSHIIAVYFAGDFGKLLMPDRHFGNERLCTNRNPELVKPLLRPLAHRFAV